ncbi:MAG: class III extradiol dioxygenase subunit B-like domain-containing protein [Patescibacteria group bacterium]|nr:class III extradiol dioxygenase subunit B-like domain-containing protein [Patescibacteria group bacterium]
MSLVFSALTPHPPLLIPTIGKAEIGKIAKTKKAMEELEEKLYATHPDIILIISPHGSFFSDAFTINSCPEYTTDLREFGDLATKIKFKGELDLAYHIRAVTKNTGFPATMISEPTIDHGSAVPLYYLTRHLPNVKIIQFGFCDLDLKTHLDFGAIIKEQVLATNKRVAVIASGDMSHALATDAPASWHPAGPEFDKKIKELLMARNTSGVITLEPEFVKNAAECGLRSLVILLGVLQGMNYTYREMAYEAPFGVGYLTAEFAL